MTAEPKTLLDLDDPDIDEATAAAAILRRLKVPALAARLLAPAVAQWLLKERRFAVRKVEQASWRGGRSLANAESLLARIHAEQDLGDLLPLLVCTFRVERGGEVVTWGEATAVQHRQRADALRRHAADTLATADRHERAAAILDEASATCLSDLITRRAAA